MKPKVKETLLKLLAFATVCAYILGAVGGLGWSLYEHSYVIAVGVLVLAVMAFPSLLKAMEVLTGPLNTPPPAGAH